MRTYRYMFLSVREACKYVPLLACMHVSKEVGLYVHYTVHTSTRVYMPYSHGNKSVLGPLFHQNVIKNESQIL